MTDLEKLIIVLTYEAFAGDVSEVMDTVFGKDMLMVYTEARNYEVIG